LIEVKSVRKIETGLERGRWLSRKLRNTVLMLSMRKGDPPEIVSEAGVKRSFCCMSTVILIFLDNH
jgi:hypothetical protein